MMEIRESGVRKTHVVRAWCHIFQMMQAESTLGTSLNEDNTLPMRFNGGNYILGKRILINATIIINIMGQRVASPRM